jgi:hypothetical protein
VTLAVKGAQAVQPLALAVALLALVALATLAAVQAQLAVIQRRELQALILERVREALVLAARPLRAPVL